ncbi:MAG: hypothetical protein ACUVTH_03285 [Thermogutta sp.]
MPGIQLAIYVSRPSPTKTSLLLHRCLLPFGTRYLVVGITPINFILPVHHVRIAGKTYD